MFPGLLKSVAVTLLNPKPWVLGLQSILPRGGRHRALIGFYPGFSSAKADEDGGVRREEPLFEGLGIFP